MEKHLIKQRDNFNLFLYPFTPEKVGIYVSVYASGNFSLCHSVQSGSGAHPTSYPTGIRGSLPEGKVAGA